MPSGGPSDVLHDGCMVARSLIAHLRHIGAEVGVVGGLVGGRHRWKEEALERDGCPTANGNLVVCNRIRKVII